MPRIPLCGTVGHETVIEKRVDADVALERTRGVRNVFSRRYVTFGALAYFGVLPRTSAAERGNADTLLIPNILDLKAPVDGLILIPGTRADARAMATRALVACQAIAAESAIKIKQLRTMDAAIEQGQIDINQLVAERNTVLDQLRNGLYCSKCYRSKAEIEATGVNFSAHLKSVKGTVVPAPASVVQAKEAEYNARIDTLRTEQNVRVGNRHWTDTYNSNLQQQFRDGVMLWRTGLLLEYGVAETQFQKADELDNKRLNAVRDVLRQLEGHERRMLLKLDGRDPTALLRLQRNQDEQTSWTEKIRPIELSIAGRRRNFDHTIVAIKDQAARDVTALTEASAAISGTKRFEMGLPDFSLSYGGWAVAVSPEQAGARFQFTNILTGGVSTQFDMNARSAESVAFIEIYGRVQVFAGTRTVLGEGDTPYPVGGVKWVDQPPPKGEPGDEGWKKDLPR